MNVIATIDYAAGGSPWTEHFNTDKEDPQVFLEEMIERFNASLRRGEKARKLISWEPTDKHKALRHDWGKTSLVTEAGGYDKMRCKRCGATGRRYGLEGVLIDSKAKNADVCKGAEG